MNQPTKEPDPLKLAERLYEKLREDKVSPELIMDIAQELDSLAQEELHEIAEEQKRDYADYWRDRLREEWEDGD